MEPTAQEEGRIHLKAPPETPRAALHKYLPIATQRESQGSHPDFTQTDKLHRASEAGLEVAFQQLDVASPAERAPRVDKGDTSAGKKISSTTKSLLTEVADMAPASLTRNFPKRDAATDPKYRVFSVKQRYETQIQAQKARPEATKFAFATEDMVNVRKRPASELEPTSPSRSCVLQRSTKRQAVEAPRQIIGLASASSALLDSNQTQTSGSVTAVSQRPGSVPGGTQQTVGITQNQKPRVKPSDRWRAPTPYNFSVDAQPSPSEHEPATPAFANFGESHGSKEYSPFEHIAYGWNALEFSDDPEDNGPAEEEDDTQSMKDRFYQCQQECYKQSEAARQAALDVSNIEQEESGNVLPGAVHMGSPHTDTQAANDGKRRTRKRRSPTPPGDQEPAASTSVSRHAKREVKRRKPGPKPRPRVITHLERYLYLPGTSTRETGRLEPITALEPGNVQRLEAALDELWHYKDKTANKACTITNPANHRTYVTQRKCLARHIVYHNGGNSTDTGKWDRKLACSTCTSSPGRPCVKLEWRPEDPEGLEPAILVIYPRPESSRPDSATWRDVEYYL
jgi:hypothetical protein